MLYRRLIRIRVRDSCFQVAILEARHQIELGGIARHPEFLATTLAIRLLFSRCFRYAYPFALVVLDPAVSRDNHIWAWCHKLHFCSWCRSGATKRCIELVATQQIRTVTGHLALAPILRSRGRCRRLVTVPLVQLGLLSNLLTCCLQMSAQWFEDHSRSLQGASACLAFLKVIDMRIPIRELYRWIIESQILIICHFSLLLVCHYELATFPNWRPFWGRLLRGVKLVASGIQGLLCQVVVDLLIVHSPVDQVGPRTSGWSRFILMVLRGRFLSATLTHIVFHHKQCLLAVGVWGRTSSRRLSNLFNFARRHRSQILIEIIMLHGRSWRFVGVFRLLLKLCSAQWIVVRVILCMHLLLVVELDSLIDWGRCLLEGVRPDNDGLFRRLLSLWQRLLHHLRIHTSL